MTENELLLLKQNLEIHIAECNHILHLLNCDILTPENQAKIDSTFDMIRYGKSHTIASMGEQRNFIDLINGVPSVAIQGYNKNRELVYWNKASEIMYGYSYYEAIGNKLEDLIITAPMHEGVIKAISDWFTHGVIIPAGELVLKRQDQTSIHVYSSHIMLGEGTDNPEMFCVDIDLSEIASLKDANTNLEKKAHFDKLTNIYNRHYFDSVISHKLSHMVIQQKELSIIMFDIDNFKKINDVHGHGVGDHSLVALIDIVKEVIREEDVFIRWGGEEFILIVETNIEKANITAEKLRETIELTTAELVGIPAFTCSFGVVSMQGYTSFEQAYKIVDEKLYLAKNNGRNRVEY